MITRLTNPAKRTRSENSGLKGKRKKAGERKKKRVLFSPKPRFRPARGKVNAIAVVLQGKVDQQGARHIVIKVAKQRKNKEKERPGKEKSED